MERHSLKRKLGLHSTSQSRKRIKRQTQQKFASRNHRAKEPHDPASSFLTSPDDLPWKLVHTDGVKEVGDDGEGGMLMLEEVENVEVVYGNREDGGRVIQFRVKQPHSTTEKDGNSHVKESVSQADGPVPIVIDSFDAAAVLPAWALYPLHPALLHSIHRRGFNSPTEIQRRTLDVFFKTRTAEENLGQPADGERRNDETQQPSAETTPRDIIGIAETGSGKTLAYGLPILHSLLTALSSARMSSPSPDHDAASTVMIKPPPPATVVQRPLQALVLAPTRELTLQVSEHLNACLDQLFAAQRRADGGEKTSEGHHKAPPPVSVAAIVGGMSAQKQRRILSRGVDILIATPGRFWDLCNEDPHLAAQLRTLHFLVLDEADRMIEAGHFQELDNILRLTSRPSQDINTGLPEEGGPPMPDDLEFADTEVHERNDSLQTFVFSATMSKDLQRDLKRKRGRPPKRRDSESSSTLDELLMRLDFRDPYPVIIDLSPEGGRVKGLQESKVECLTNDKDVYLYYFLLRHPGRSLVFLSSIDGIRRLMPLLELLKLNVWPLHSGLQQKQRLKNLDRFKSVPNGVLLATDIAARGLDVPAVDHVIHYQVPRTADSYVHRNGRTARAMRKGFGLVLCAPDERRVFRNVLSGLRRDEDDVPELNVDGYLVDKLKARVQLARRIDGMVHRAKKETHDRRWMREAAEAMEVELPDELESDRSEDASVVSKKVIDGKVAALKAELKEMLARPLMAKGVSRNYVTLGSHAIAHDILEGRNHETMLGLRRLEAGRAVVRGNKKQKQKAEQRKRDG